MFQVYITQVDKQLNVSIYTQNKYVKLYKVVLRFVSSFSNVYRLS